MAGYSTIEYGEPKTQKDLLGPATTGQSRQRPGTRLGIASASLATVTVKLNASLAPSLDSPTGTLQTAEHRAIRCLAVLVEEVVVRLETPARHESPVELIPECNAALEACLEHLRDLGDGDNRVGTARDDLRRLSRLLKLVDDADVPFVMRQIRRVLGRFDACAGSLLEELRG